MSDVNVDAKWTLFQSQLPKNKTIIFHCAAGARAVKVTRKLSDLGYQTAFFEGPDQWQNSGLLLEKGPAQQSIFNCSGLTNPGIILELPHGFKAHPYASEKTFLDFNLFFKTTKHSINVPDSKYLPPLN